MLAQVVIFQKYHKHKEKINRINGLSKIDEEDIIINEDDNLIIFFCF